MGAVFAESSTRWYGGEDRDEKEAILWSILNMSHYAVHKPANKTRCYNQSFGNGSVLSAIQHAIVAYGSPRWNTIMDGNSLKSEETLASKLTGDDREHLRLVAEVVVAAGPTPQLPKALATLGDRVPVQFNQATNSPPSRDRQEKIGKLGRHTFYAFKEGRTCD